MAKKIVFVLLVVLTTTCVFALESLQSSAGEIAMLEPIQKSDRILILAPHPDDEAIGCAGIIQEALKAGAELHVVYLTNGDHNQVAFLVYEKRLVLRKNGFIHMGEVRRTEAIKAMRLLGLSEDKLIFLGYPDFGTFTIFRDFWRAKTPFKSWLTRISSVPYKENLSFGAPYTGESILADLEFVLKKYQPTKIFVSHSADVNVDHKAFYLFLQVALANLEKELPRPKIYPYLVHCVGWPLPRHYHPELSLLPPRQFSDSPIKWFKRELSSEELNKKYQSILCYKSQTASSAFYLLAFARKNELFGDYPEINLVSPLVKKEERKSLKDKLVSFFGESNMFVNTGIGAKDNLAVLTATRGRVGYAVTEDSLLIHIDRANGISCKFSILAYLFGYSYNKPFRDMPKIWIIVKGNRFKVRNARKIIKTEDVKLELNSEELTLSIPLKILGEPDFVLASVKAYTGAPPVYTTGFQKINIRRK